MLGPILFPLGNINSNQNIQFHCYVDDTQLYLPIRPITDIKCWMSSHFFQLNDKKSEAVLFSHHLARTQIGKPTAKNLVLFDPDLNLEHVEKVIHAFIYCTCLSQKSLNRLQLVRKAADRLLTGPRKCNHITPILASLHWLPDTFRLDLKCY